MLSKIIESDCANINLIIRKVKSDSTERNLIRKFLNKKSTLIYLASFKIDSKFFKPTNSPFNLRKISDLIHTDEIIVSTIETRYSDCFKIEDVERIKSYGLDIIIRLGFKILKGDILNASKYGIWSYHHGDNRVNRGGPPGIWEVIQGWEETGVTLQILNEDLDGGKVLGYSNTSTDKLSFSRNQNQQYWNSVSLLPRKIKELYIHGEEFFFDRVDNQASLPQFYDRRLYKTPGNLVMIKFLTKFIYNVISRKVRNKFFIDQWILLFKISQDERISTSLYKFKKIIPPVDRFWADPFVIEKNDIYYIFIEELFFVNNKGHISVIEMDKNGNFKQPNIVLSRDYHLSYPNVFEMDGDMYMIPETKANNSIELYKSSDFPYKWDLVEVLMENVSAVDSTILKKNGRYWLFTNIRQVEGGSNHNELFIFSSENLLHGSWIPHNDNPVKSDIKSARPAGNFFFQNDRLYRPSQNCGKHYGYGLAINEVIRCNDDEYQEETIQFIYPNWDRKIKGIHTLNHCGKLTVIDAIYQRRKF